MLFKRRRKGKVHCSKPKRSLRWQMKPAAKTSRRHGPLANKKANHTTVLRELEIKRGKWGESGSEKKKNSHNGKKAEEKKPKRKRIAWEEGVRPRGHSMGPLATQSQLFFLGTERGDDGGKKKASRVFKPTNKTKRFSKLHYKLGPL